MLRHLCRDRFLEDRPRSNLADCFLDAAEALAEDSDDEDDDEDEIEERGGDEDDDSLLEFA